MSVTHIFRCRLDTRRGDATNASVAFCGFSAPDLRRTKDDLVPWWVSDLSAFALDSAATCRECRRLRAGTRPGLLRRWWRWLTRRGTWFDELTSETEGRAPGDFKR